MTEARYDVVIIGSGAGGGTIAYALADTGRRILLIERGDFIPQEADNWSPKAVWKDKKYRAVETWIDDRNWLFPRFTPYTHYCVGGNTKFWGAALFRLRPEDFQEVEHPGGISPAWPVNYETMAPYYRRAEALYEVRGEHAVDPTEGRREAFPFPPMAHTGRIPGIVEALRAQGLHPFPLPLGLRANCEPCETCNSFACRIHAKSDAEVCCIEPVQRGGAVTLLRNAYARTLITDASGAKVTAVEIEYEGQRRVIESSLFIVSCGAVNSAPLLLRSKSAAHPDGLANSSGLVGRHYMAHLATILSGRGREVNDTVFQKTVAINDYYSRGALTPVQLGQIQSQGRTDAVTLKSESPWYGKWIPLPAWEWWVRRSVDWLVMSEDLPDPGNRVTVDGDGRIRLHYKQNNTEAHEALVGKTKRLLNTLGFWPVITYSLGKRNTTHQCGTLRFGADPRSSVLDPFCRSHDVANLFVVDASFFPSSAAVNPGLTIVAQALRTADHIKEQGL